MEVGDRYGKLVVTKLLDEKNKDGADQLSVNVIVVQMVIFVV